MLSIVQKPARESIFKQHYLPGLERNRIDNVILCRITDCGYGVAGTLMFMPLVEACWRIERFFSEELRSVSALTLTSTVSVEGNLRHLLLLDFSLPANNKKNDEELCHDLLDALWVLPALRGGLILRTRHSYHAVGFEPLSRNEWERHMRSAMLLQTRKGDLVVDRTYMELSLQRGYGSLRFTDFDDKGTPEIVSVL